MPVVLGLIAVYPSAASPLDVVAPVGGGSRTPLGAHITGVATTPDSAHGFSRRDPLDAAALASQAGTPQGRYIHTSIFHPSQNRMLTFGGGTFDVVNQFWELTLGTSPAWTQLTPVGTQPPARAGHTAVYDPVRDRMIVFGGGDPTRRNDTWVYSASDASWSTLSTAGTPPPPLSLHAAIYDPPRDRMIVFGGFQDTGYVNGIWALSLSGTPTWSSLTPSGVGPAPRREHSAIYDPLRDRMIVFGGTDGACSNEVWALNFTGQPSWERLTAAGALPAARSGHTSIYDPTRDLMWVFAGRDGTGTLLNDLWTLSLSGTPTWTRIDPAGSPPGVRAYHTAIRDAADRMVVFSGYNGGLPNDTWFLSLGPVPTWYQLGSQPPPPPPTVPTPVFTTSALGAATIVLGQSFTVTLAVRNDGPASDNGRITVGFPSFAAAADGQWVVKTNTSDDTPGFVQHVAGSTITDIACQPMTAGYLTAEYSDNAWSAYGNETNNLTLQIQPQTAGTFAFEVRSTLHRSGGSSCDDYNGVPANGEGGHVDQQGWEVRRYTVTVLPPPSAPQPRFVSDVTGIPTSIALGQSITLTTSVLNDGAASDDGRISVSFPTLNGASDAQRVFSSTSGDSPGLIVTAAGGALANAQCASVTAQYLSVEYADNNWLWLGTERNDLTVRVTPPLPGSFMIDVRTTMRRTGSACDLVTALPSGGQSGYVDQQGFVVKRYVVNVVPPVPPTPTFTAVTGLPASISLGQSFTFSLTVRNDGAVTNDGRIAVSLPSFTTPSDQQWVTTTSSGDNPGFVAMPAGSSIITANCQMTTASYLVAEYRDDGWGGYPNAAESNTFTLTVTPQTTGTFYVDVRATMHTTDPTCAFVNGVPAQGEAGHVDQQGWAVRRFAVTVLTPAPIPVFTAGIGVPSSIVIGHDVSIAIPVRNDGGPSDDGRITVSFPSFTAATDGQWVSSPSGGDTPGYRELPAGSSLVNASCQTMAANYLAVEYADDAWNGSSSETNILIVTARPQATGPFVIDVRTTMHTTGGVTCALVNAVPPGSPTVTDQQGFTVRRYTVMVLPPPPPDPIPVFASLTGVPTSIILGQSFTLSAVVGNDGADSDDGRVSFSFPSLTQPADTQFLDGTFYALPGLRKVPSGSSLVTALCQTVSATFAIAEGVDNTWVQGQSDNLVLTVRPPQTGTFVFYVRATLHKTGGSACTAFNALPPGGEAGFLDQQGWPVKRYVVRVDPPPTDPDPAFVGVAVPSSVTLGQTLTLSCVVRNDGSLSDDGRISLSFPTLTASTDHFWVTPQAGDDTPGTSRLPVGTALVGASCQSVVSSYVAAEYRDNSWGAVGTESNTFIVTVRPQVTGAFPIDIRAALHRSGGDPCDLVTDVPIDGTAGFTDQQGFAVKRYIVMVNAPTSPPRPDPVFTSSVSGIPTSIALGENFTVIASVRNAGMTSDDGRVGISFPRLDSPADGRWVTSVGSAEEGSVSIVPAGGLVTSAACVPTAASYLSIEYRDPSWLGFNNETHTFKVTVQPQSVGSFEVYVRSTMHVTGGGACDLETDLPPAGAPSTDQQGFAVSKYTVQVLAPSTPTTAATVSWQRLVPTGDPPPARYGHASVYDAGRDRMVMVAGNWGDCDIYNWALELSSPRWVSLPTFVGPGQRTDERWRHTAVYDPVSEQVVVYGGECLALKPDVMALDLANPISWARELGSGSPPSAREGHVAVYDPIRSRMLVIGGYDGTARNDVWELTLPGMVWRQLQPMGDPFPPRSDASAVYDPVRDRVVVFGGETGGWLNDVWALELSPSLRWVELGPTGIAPSPRHDQTAIYDPGQDRLLMFGGGDLGRRSDLWALNLSGFPTWTRLWSSTVGPSGRLLPTAFYDAPRHRMVVYGGEIGPSTYSDEVWAMNLDVPTATMLSLVSAEPHPSFVHLAWSAVGAANLRATVYRQSDSTGGMAIGTARVAGDLLSYDDYAVTPGGRYGYRLAVNESDGETYSSTVWVTVPARPLLALTIVGPGAGHLDIRFSLPDDALATLTIYDLAGRLRSERSVGSEGKGEHQLTLGETLPPGVYLVRLTHGSETLRSKAALLR